MAFDPYHKWLGVPPAEQPPNHYRLLGISVYENDPDVIETAADQRMALLRTFQAGPHSALSQKLLNELSAARLCLLTPEKKRSYDQELSRQFSAASREQAVPQARPLMATPVVPVAPAEIGSPALIVTNAPRHTVRRRRTGIGPVASVWLALAAIAVPATTFVAYLISTKAELKKEVRRPTRAAGNIKKSDNRKPRPSSTPEAKDGPQGQPTESSFVALFNGKDFSGWKVIGNQAWRVRDATLAAQGSATPGWLMSDRDYENFEIELQYRLAPGAHSGVFLRAREGGVIGKDFQEVQILDDDAPAFKQLGSDVKNGAIWRQVAPNKQVAAPAGSWNRLGVVVRGDRVQVRVNGIEVVDGRLPGGRPSTGRIGLQFSEKGVEFRDVRVRTTGLDALGG